MVGAWDPGGGVMPCLSKRGVLEGGLSSSAGCIICQIQDAVEARHKEMVEACLLLSPFAALAGLGGALPLLCTGID